MRALPLLIATLLTLPLIGQADFDRGGPGMDGPGGGGFQDGRGDWRDGRGGDWRGGPGWGRGPGWGHGPGRGGPGWGGGPGRGGDWGRGPGRGGDWDRGGPQQSMIAQALDSGALVSVQTECRMGNIGSIAPCQTYSINYNRFNSTYTASGPAFPAMNFTTAAYVGPSPYTNQLVIWGAVFQFDNFGTLYQNGLRVGTVFASNQGGGPVPPPQQFNDAASRLRRGEMLNATLYQNVGQLAAGRAYSVTYDQRTRGFTVTGAGISSGFMTRTDYNANLDIGQVSLWGALFQLDQSDNLYLNGQIIGNIR